MPSNARLGLDKLLAEYPDADISQVIHQLDSNGPWTCVDLRIDGQRTPFAIWNHTGNVYRVEGPDGEYPGAVEDDPFLTVTLLG